MREHYGTKLDKTLKEKFLKLSLETRIPQSKLLDEAIEDLLEKYSKLNYPTKKEP